MDTKTKQVGEPEEVEREYMESQGGWECAAKNCYGYIEVDDGEQDELDDTLDDMLYEAKYK